MAKGWNQVNCWYQYLLPVVDVFSQVEDLNPLKDRKKPTVALAFEQVIHDMGTQKTVFIDKVSEFKNNEFQKVLDNPSRDCQSCPEHSTDAALTSVTKILLG